MKPDRKFFESDVRIELYIQPPAERSGGYYAQTRRTAGTEVFFEVVRLTFCHSVTLSHYCDG